MGTFGEYYGNMDIPKEKREEFSGQMLRILDYGGMMDTDTVRLFGHDLTLLEPVRTISKNKIFFAYNYFEDTWWETASYDVNEAMLQTEKIGNREYCDVVTAAYCLYEMYDAEPGMVRVGGDVISSQQYAGWLNHLLGTKFTMQNRLRLWENFEPYCIWRMEHNYSPIQKRDILCSIPDELLSAAGGTDLTDLLYIVNGTGTLSESTVKPGTYPYDVYQCKKILRQYFEDCQYEDALQQICDMVQLAKTERNQIAEKELLPLCRLSQKLPARVILYLATEIAGLDFWDLWAELREHVYHDEIFPEYTPTEIMEYRKRQAEIPIPPVKTSDFLRQDGFFTFLHTPKELAGQPNYYISDDDRMYWWDASDEVVLSEDTVRWLEGLADRHRKLMEELSDSENEKSEFLKEFIMLLSETNQYYHRIFPFKDMFYEFIRNIHRKEFRAAVELFRVLAEENLDEGKIIEKSNRNWEMENYNVTHNIARLRLKRYLSIMANQRLRMSYFGF